jgi:hypothetical protein
VVSGCPALTSEAFVAVVKLTESNESVLDPTINIPMAQIGFQAASKILPSFFNLGITQGKRQIAGINQRQKDRPIGGVNS